MARLRLTKNELKTQKDDLKRYRRYLPTLQLKKQLLQVEIRKVEALRDEARVKQSVLRAEIEQWISVFGEDLNLADYLDLESIQTEEGNIAGVAIPVFKGVVFEDLPWDLLALPPWVDRGIEDFKRILSYDVEVAVLEEQARLLEQELRTTSQRVNLFEKVKIPEARSNIRTINIALGDQQTAAVVRGKIAKSNLVSGVSS